MELPLTLLFHSSVNLPGRSAGGADPSTCELPWTLEFAMVFESVSLSTSER